MNSTIVRAASGWSLIAGGIYFALMSLQGGGPYEAVKVGILGLAFLAAGLFLLMNPQGRARVIALSLGSFAVLLMGAVTSSYETGGSLGHPLLDLVIALFVGSYGISLYAMTRHVLFRERIPGLEPGKKIR